MRCHIHEDMRVNCLTSRKWITTFLPDQMTRGGLAGLWSVFLGHICLNHTPFASRFILHHDRSSTSYETLR